MRVKILRHTLGNANGISLRHYLPGHVYDLPPNIANYLVIQGIATFEMRIDEHPRPPGQVERRRPNAN